MTLFNITNEFLENIVITINIKTFQNLLSSQSSYFSLYLYDEKGYMIQKVDQFPYTLTPSLFETKSLHLTSYIA